MQNSLFFPRFSLEISMQILFEPSLWGGGGWHSYEGRGLTPRFKPFPPFLFTTLYRKSTPFIYLEQKLHRLYTSKISQKQLIFVPCFCQLWSRKERSWTRSTWQAIKVSPRVLSCLLALRLTIPKASPTLMCFCLKTHPFWDVYAYCPH